MLLIQVTIFVIIFNQILCQYQPNWASLDARPLPEWYDGAKIGIFLHWGIFSVPAFGNEWFWKRWKDGEPDFVNFMKQNYRPGFTYQDFGPEFRGEFFNPDDWVNLFQAAGARYVVLTSKHHEGFTLWPSKYSWGWNSVDTGPARDLCGALSESVRRLAPEIRFGLYHSLLEWYNPLLKEDEMNFFRTNYFAANKSIPGLKELVELYKPEILWSDGDWIGTPEYWESKEFLAWLFNYSPVNETIVVNDRWGLGTSCLHGSYFTCSDNYDPGEVKNYKWETCLSLDKKSWGFRREAVLDDYLSIEVVLHRLAKTVSMGGNFLLNVGPTSYGTISPIMEERLRQMGRWLSTNGEAVYDSHPWHYQNDSIANDVWYTQKSKGKLVYCLILEWPKSQNIVLGNVRSTPETIVRMLGYNRKLIFKEEPESKGVRVYLPDMKSVNSTIIWTLKLKNIR